MLYNMILCIYHRHLWQAAGCDRWRACEQQPAWDLSGGELWGEALGDASVGDCQGLHGQDRQERPEQGVGCTDNGRERFADTDDALQAIQGLLQYFSHSEGMLQGP